jgi:hypothetical protein
VNSLSYRVYVVGSTQITLRRIVFPCISRKTPYPEICKINITSINLIYISCKIFIFLYNEHLSRIDQRVKEFIVYNFKI